MVQGRKWLGSPHCAGRVPAAAGAQRAASQPASPAQSRGPAAPTPRSWAFLLAQLSRRNPSPSPCTCFPPTSHPYPCTVPPGQETFSAPFGHLSLSPCPRLSALPPLVSLSACLCLPVSRCPCLCLYLSVSLSPCPCLCLPDSPSVSRSVSSCLPVSPSSNHLLPFQFFVPPRSVRSVTSGLLFSFLLITQQIPRKREPPRAFSLPASPVIFKHRERTVGP